MMRDWWPHGHSGRDHAHAWSTTPHDHAQRAVCTRAECAGCETHNVHPAPASLGEELREAS